MADLTKPMTLEEALAQIDERARATAAELKERLRAEFEAREKLAGPLDSFLQKATWIGVTELGSGGSLRPMVRVDLNYNNNPGDYLADGALTPHAALPKGEYRLVVMILPK